MASATDAVKAYFDAWNEHNTQSILDSLTPDGTYSDPVGGENLSGQTYADYAASLFTAFPDLSLELISNTVASNGIVAAKYFSASLSAPYRISIVAITFTTMFLTEIAT